MPAAIAQHAEDRRWLIQGSGIAGDPGPSPNRASVQRSAYVPWLVGHMGKNETARLTGGAWRQQRLLAQLE